MSKAISEAEVVIDEEFKSLCPPLAKDELAKLRENIARHGCHSPLIVWEGTGLLLDGHNRYAICTELGIEFEIHAIPMDSREDACNYIIDNQLGRRNLNEEQASYLRGKRYHTEKRSRAGAPEGNTSKAGKTKHQWGQTVPIDSDSKTSEKIGKDLGLSGRTIRRDAQFATAVDEIAKNVGEEARQTILSGDAPVSKETVVAIAKLPAEEQAQALAAAPKSDPQPPIKGRKKQELSGPRIRSGDILLTAAKVRKLHQAIQELFDVLNKPSGVEVSTITAKFKAKELRDLWDSIAGEE